MVLFAPSGDGVAPFPQFDKVVRAGLVALLARTAGWRFGAPPVVLALLCAYGPLSEVVQALLLPHRDSDWRDAATDLLGVALGSLVAGRALRRTRDQAGSRA